MGFHLYKQSLKIQRYDIYHQNSITFSIYLLISKNRREIQSKDYNLPITNGDDQCSMDSNNTSLCKLLI